ncbi:MAG TPA: hypothetical protein DCS93_05130 [Microscillaceae bacterium]|nr:hypothetical protein [Microscillaceae bacterium]
MNITLDNFDFKVSSLTEVAEVDKLLAEYDLQIKSREARLGNREVQLQRAETRTDNLDEDILELEALIATKEFELTKYPAGSNKHGEISVNLGVDKARLEALKFRRNGNVSPVVVVERNADAGEEQVLLAYYKQFRDALLARKTALGA